jgi:hypothetical protein
LTKQHGISLGAAPISEKPVRRRWLLKALASALLLQTDKVPVIRYIQTATAGDGGSAMSADQADAPPRKVLLFSGHMIDAPGRKEPRFPADKEPIAAGAIAKAVAEIDAGPGDVAICSGACGGDLLFAEACLARGLRLELYIPFDEATFLSNSVDFAGPPWRDRFFAAKSKAALHVMPDELGPLPKDADPYERVNLWMLKSAARFGEEKVFFLCLWDGRGGDGPGGTKHLMDEVQRKSGRTLWLNTTTLWS